MKLKASYESPEELKKLISQLRQHNPRKLTFKESKNNEGRFKKAYIEIEQSV